MNESLLLILGNSLAIAALIEIVRRLEKRTRLLLDQLSELTKDETSDTR